MTDADKIQRDLQRLENYGSEKGTPISPKQEAIYIVLKEVDGNLQIMGDTKTPDKGVAIKKADDLAIGNGTDYLVAKIISRHKKRVSTDVINYE